MSNRTFKPGNWFTNAKRVLESVVKSEKTNGIYTEAGDISSSDIYVIIEATTAPYTLTLNDGYIGQEVLIFANETSGGDITVSGRSIDVIFNLDGQYTRLMYLPAGWVKSGETTAIIA